MDVGRTIEKAAESAHEASEALCALAFDVLSRQAEGRVLFAGEDFVRKKAAAHGIDLEEKETHVVDGRDVVALLERGPTADDDYALIACMAALGMKDEAAARYIEHADWLTFSTPYPAYDAAVQLLDADGAFFDALEASLGELDDTPEGAAAKTMRSKVLQAAGRSAEQATSRRELHLEGSMRRPVRYRILRWITGWALLMGLLRLLGALFRVQRGARIELTPRGVSVSTWLSLLGKRTIAQQALHHPGSVKALFTSESMSALPSTLGAAAFGLGVFAGAFFLVDGLMTGETVLLLIAAALVAGGAILDLGAAALARRSGRRGSLELAFDQKPGVRIEGLDPEAVERFAAAAAKQLGHVAG
ncbi:MAG: hypothetical protein AAF411_01700 [Myxococcota bacterium]